MVNTTDLFATVGSHGFTGLTEHQARRVLEWSQHASLLVGFIGFRPLNGSGSRTAFVFGTWWSKANGAIHGTMMSSGSVSHVLLP